MLFGGGGGARWRVGVVPGVGTLGRGGFTLTGGVMVETALFSGWYRAAAASFPVGWCRCRHQLVLAVHGSAQLNRWGVVRRAEGGSDNGCARAC